MGAHDFMRECLQMIDIAAANIVTDRIWSSSASYGRIAMTFAMPGTRPTWLDDPRDAALYDITVLCDVIEITDLFMIGCDQTVMACGNSMSRSRTARPSYMRTKTFKTPTTRTS